MRGHTGGYISCRVVIIHEKASKKLYTKNTTELEVFSVSEYVPYKIHTIIIFLGLGCNLYKNILYQDNECTIKMKKNGRNLCTGNSRHIYIRFFFVKDRVNKETFSIKYCHTSLMLLN